MPLSTAKLVFVTSCLLGLIAIIVGALLEVSRQRRGESLLRPNQFRLRIFSAFIWMIALGSLAYAVGFLWPEKGDVVAARKFLSLLSGALTLVFIAILLLAYDVWQFLRERKIRQMQFEKQLEELARSEIAKLKSHEAGPEKAGDVT